MRSNYMKSIFAALGLAVLASASCDDNSPRAQCENLLESFCEKIVSCDGRLEQNACMTALGKEIDCSKAVEVTGVDKCQEDLRARSCTGFALPTTCRGSIKVQ
jgi:hypothetical protein